MNKKIMVLGSAFLLSSCATVFTGTTDSIVINTSTGDEAKVEVISAAGAQTFDAPVSVTVPRAKQNITVKVKDKCYEETKAFVNYKTNLWVIGDLLFGLIGATGTTIDASTGALWDYQDQTTIHLKKKPSCK